MGLEDLEDIENGELDYQQGEYFRHELGNRIFGAVTESQEYVKGYDSYALPDGRYLRLYHSGKGDGFTYILSDTAVTKNGLEDYFPEGYYIDHNPRNLLK